MALVFPNRAWMTTATTGTGTITLGAAQSSYLTFAEAGVANADTANYTILDGANFESGVGTYTSAGTTFSRDTVTVSKIAGVAGTSKISLSGTATIFLTQLSAEIAGISEANIFTANQIIRSTDAGAGVGPTLTLDRFSASPAANDFIGNIEFTGRDAGGGTDTYAWIISQIVDHTAGSEDGLLQLRAMVGGAQIDYVKLSGGVVDFPQGQLKFPATQNASADANTLDDYEEGSTTPTPTAGSGTFTSVSCALSYTKIGRIVHVGGSVIITTAGTAAGEIIVPLPFTSTSISVGAARENTVTGAMGQTYVQNTDTAVHILKYDNTTLIASGRTILFSITYEA